MKIFKGFFLSSKKAFSNSNNLKDLQVNEFETALVEHELINEE
jgi:hypothetical protein